MRLTLFLGLLLCGVAMGNQRTAVLVFPFTSLGQTDTYEWMGQAVQQNLLTDLTRTPNLATLSPPPGAAVNPNDHEAYRRIASAAGASYAVFGTYQIGEMGLRINGHVMDVRRGMIIGGMKATGSVRDLFLMEDTLAEQAKRILVPVPAPKSIPDEPTGVPQAVSVPRGPIQFPWDVDEPFAPRRTSRYYGDYAIGFYNYTYAPGWTGYFGGGWYPYPGYYPVYPCYRLRRESLYRFRATRWFNNGTIQINW